MRRIYLVMCAVLCLSVVRMVFAQEDMPIEHDENAAAINGFPAMGKLLSAEHRTLEFDGQTREYLIQPVNTEGLHPAGLGRPIKINIAAHSYSLDFFPGEAYLRCTGE